AGKVIHFESTKIQNWFLLLGPIGVYVYITGFTLPLDFDVPLILLASISILASISNFSTFRFNNTSLNIPLIGFLAATILSISMSEDIGRSIRLSSALIPAALIYLLISYQFHNFRQILFLYSILSIISLGLSVILILTAWNNYELNPVKWISIASIPIFVVPNDITFLALIAPLSASLLFLGNNKNIKILSITSIAFTFLATCLYQSRTATFTTIVALTTVSALLAPRKLKTCSFLLIILILLILLIDGFLGFPLLAKFGNGWDPRIAAWLTAIAIFLDAPIFGHGPHTFGLFYMQYLNGLDLPVWLTVDPRIFPWAHNLYLEVLAEQGVIGLATLVLLLAIGLITAWKIKRSDNDHIRILAMGAFVALTGFCFAGIFEVSLLRQWAAIFLFLILGVISKLSIMENPNKEVTK
ncbi:O-antigen ligase family protein, partial [bacterium]|nr:O-antigen ligase family protein [bacterium]